MSVSNAVNMTVISSKIHHAKILWPASIIVDCGSVDLQTNGVLPADVCLSSSPRSLC